jgi:hypothetical protein
MAEKITAAEKQDEASETADPGLMKQSKIKQSLGKAVPGVCREQRISDEGLKRLEKQLQCGVNISEQVLNQWLKRYGDDARDLIIKYRGKDDKLSEA